MLFQPITQVGHGCTVRILLERLLHIRSQQRVGLVMPGLIDHVAERNRAAIINTLEGVFGHAAYYLFGQVSGIILGIAFQH